MAAVTISGMLAAESAAMANGWTEEQLLDLAGQRLGRAIGRYFPTPGFAIGYLGKGHNAGDTLVALKLLRDEFGWRIAVRYAWPLDQCAPLTHRKWQEMGKLETFDSIPPWRDIEGSLLLLDGLVGSGASGPLRSPLLSLAEEMEWLRQNAGARVAATDLPSGIDANTGAISPGTVTADVTFMIGNPKQGLLTGHAANATGALALVPVEPLTASEPSPIELIAPQTMDFGKSRRPFDFHKGKAGHVALLAGSPQYTGAGVLAAIGALRGGAGLVTLYVPHQAADLVSSKCPPEIIVRGYSSPAEIVDPDFDSLVIGCGIGKPTADAQEGLFNLISRTEIPTVLDADALNLIAAHDQAKLLKDNHLLTPHPGEFRRLAPDLADLSREAAAEAFVSRWPVTLLLKGCRTIVARSGQPLWCNSTGNPGMASGGQGDLLAGVIGAALASGSPAMEAAALAAWTCGRAAEAALHHNELSEEALTPLDVAQYLGTAFLDWKQSRR